MRIISLLPSTTEICYSLGLGDQIVGVTHECDYPEDARRKPHLTRNVLPPGRFTSAEIDRLVSERVRNGQPIYELDANLMAELEPDLILTQALCEVCAVSYDDVLAVARSLPKVPEVLSFEPDSTEGILQSISEVARAAGVEAEGERVLADLRGRLDAVEARVAGAEPVRAVCLEWLDPPMVGGHWAPEMVRRAGGIDLLGQEGEKSTYTEWDRIVAANPDVVIAMPCGYDLEWTLQETQVLHTIPAFMGLRAVRESQVYAVDGSAYFNRPGPRVVDGVELLARIFHPSRCAGIGPCGGVRKIHPGSRVAKAV